MCGVCGIASLRGSLNQDLASSRVRGMVQALGHRGPDETGEIVDTYAALGAARLAIRGLSSGKQPLVDRASGVTVVCNGEIDNHHELRTWLEAHGRPVELATDIAVIPGLYLELDTAFVQRLIGNFAIAIWDPRRRRVVFARDRAGERPLFFAVQNHLIRFSTEIAALACDHGSPLTLDREALGNYLQFGCFAAPKSPFQEIQKVAPAEIVTIDANGIQQQRYWRWEIPTTPKRAASVDGFDTVFREAVRRQSDVDVPYGVFLSGGVDSSLVAAVARAVRPDYKLKAYTLRFSEKSYDEGLFAERVGQMLGIETVPVWVTPEAIRDGIGELVSLVGEPLADPAWMPTALLARRASQDVKLTLVGEGGDELFGGYPTYIGAQFAARYARLPRLLKATIAGAVNAWPPSNKKVALSFLLKKFVQGADLDGVSRHLSWTSNIPPALLRQLGVEPVVQPAVDHSPEALLDLVQQRDLETSLAEGLLTKADRASMSSALELRAPFLDRDVMEFAATLPRAERVHGTKTKVFLKRYALRYLPSSIVNRKKRGLSVPLAAWLRGPLREWAESQLYSELLGDAGLNNAAALKLLEEHCQRRADHARVLWTLIVLSKWLTWASERGTP
ncbi:MAG TPA: asparagine synthase (glutamine-hydrolyzing) [Verrucomicrobiae bacterium]|nr:asparagine synthase (glutamine-hydrolyzing) [Verrucomicrobiae bacterium]